MEIEVQAESKFGPVFIALCLFDKQLQRSKWINVFVNLYLCLFCTTSPNSQITVREYDFIINYICCQLNIMNNIINNKLWISTLESGINLANLDFCLSNNIHWFEGFILNLLTPFFIYVYLCIVLNLKLKSLLDEQYYQTRDCHLCLCSFSLALLRTSNLIELPIKKR